MFDYVYVRERGVKNSLFDEQNTASGNFKLFYF